MAGHTGFAWTARVAVMVVLIAGMWSVPQAKGNEPLSITGSWGVGTATTTCEQTGPGTSSCRFDAEVTHGSGAVVQCNETAVHDSTQVGFCSASLSGDVTSSGLLAGAGDTCATDLWTATGTLAYYSPYLGRSITMAVSGENTSGRDATLEGQQVLPDGTVLSLRTHFSFDCEQPSSSGEFSGTFLLTGMPQPTVQTPLPCSFPLTYLVSRGDSTGNVIIGTTRDDQLWGTELTPDIIYGLAGDDALKGLGGNDVLCAGPGVDGVNGGSDNDQIFGQENRDFLVAGGGADLVYGGEGIDGIYGGTGADQLYTGELDPTDVGTMQDDGIADYVVGGNDPDVITTGFDDEFYQDRQPNPTTDAAIDRFCPGSDHSTDKAQRWIPKLGTWFPKRLQVVNTTKSCRTFAGEVTRVGDKPGDGDRHIDVYRDATTIEMLATEIPADTGNGEIDPLAPLAAVQNRTIIIEFMPREVPHFPNSIAVGDHITVRGLYVIDEEHDWDELHPVFWVKKGENRWFSGPMHAGSPAVVRPGSDNKGAFINTPNPDGHRYCWYEGGAPCGTWNGDKGDPFQ